LISKYLLRQEVHIDASLRRKARNDKYEAAL
jgi:hypothetical protein